MGGERPKERGNSSESVSCDSIAEGRPRAGAEPNRGKRGEGERVHLKQLGHKQPY